MIAAEESADEARQVADRWRRGMARARRNQIMHQYLQLGIEGFWLGGGAAVGWAAVRLVGTIVVWVAAHLRK